MASGIFALFSERGLWFSWFCCCSLCCMIIVGWDPGDCLVGYLVEAALATLTSQCTRRTATSKNMFAVIFGFVYELKLYPACRTCFFMRDFFLLLMFSPPPEKLIPVRYRRFALSCCSRALSHFHVNQKHKVGSRVIIRRSCIK